MNFILKSGLENNIRYLPVTDLSKTEYRIIVKPTLLADEYLQFKSTARKKSFPDFWNTSKTTIWRYIPTINTHVWGRIDESRCPVRFSEFNENYLVGCYMEQEDFDMGSIISFVNKYPNINDYFREFNSRRDKYLEERIKNNCI